MNFLDERLPDRFWDKCIPDPMGGCWLWIAGTAAGYGQITMEGRRRAQAHRLTVEAARGPIPAGLFVDHKCENKLCVNPAHLDVVSCAENLRRHWIRHPVTVCTQGHPLVEGSFYVFAGTKHCKVCWKEATKRSHDRNTARGLCRCGRERADGRSRCHRCLEMSKQHRNGSQESRR